METNDKWFSTQISNNQATKDAFEAKWKEQEAGLLREGWSREEVDSVKAFQTNKFVKSENPMLDMLENPSKGAIVIKQSYNREMDLRNEFQGSILVGKKGAEREKKTFTRPAVDEKGPVYWSEW
jgi:hypothetical protein